MEAPDTYFSSRDIQSVIQSPEQVKDLLKWKENSIHLTSHKMICEAMHDVILFVVDEYLAKGGSLESLKTKYDSVKPKGGLFTSEIFQK